MAPPVSVLILTLDEELNLPRCLAALDWCDDIVVLDSGSTDGTVEIAQRHGARILERPFDTFAAQRNFGLEALAYRHDWVLHLDADEVVTEALVKEMTRRLGEESLDAYQLPSRLMFMGQWLKRCGDYPTYQVRLGKIDRLRFEQVGHGQREVIEPDRLGTFESDYLHYSFAKGLDDWFERHNRYSSDEARRIVEGHQGTGGIAWRELFSTDAVARRRALKDAVAGVPCRGMLRFVYLYVLKGGFLDGAAGLRYCRMMSVYEQMTSIKVGYLRQQDP